MITTLSRPVPAQELGWYHDGPRMVRRRPSWLVREDNRRVINAITLLQVGQRPEATDVLLRAWMHDYTARYELEFADIETAVNWCERYLKYVPYTVK